MRKHTPGPWHVLPDVDRIRDSARIFAGSKFIGMIGNSDDTHEQTYSNAELVAAAPELLEALEAALPLLHTGDELPMSYYKDKPCALGKALMAIAKAKGEQFPQPSKKTGGDPCGECHLQAGETCDICGAIAKAKGE